MWTYILHYYDFRNKALNKQNMQKGKRTGVPAASHSQAITPVLSYPRVALLQAHLPSVPEAQLAVIAASHKAVLIARRPAHIPSAHAVRHLHPASLPHSLHIPQLHPRACCYKGELWVARVRRCCPELLELAWAAARGLLQEQHDIRRQSCAEFTAAYMYVERMYLLAGIALLMCPV
jgi:hypothetical protein